MKTLINIWRWILYQMEEVVIVGLDALAWAIDMGFYYKIEIGITVLLIVGVLSCILLY